MLAKPGLIPGRGEGMAASTSDRAIAAAARRAMRWSSAVVGRVRVGMAARRGAGRRAQ